MPKTHKENKKRIEKDTLHIKGHLKNYILI